MGHVSGRRFSVALLSVVVLGLLAVAPAGTAWAAGDRAAATSNSQWLARQLAPDGTLQNPLGGALPDHGLMIDVLFAMQASGDSGRAAPIVRYLAKHATDYYTWDGLVPGQGYDAIITGGAAAKVLVAAEIAGRDPRDFGGHDMVAETKGAIMRSGPDKGRVSDYSKNPDFKDFVSNNANMFGQALGVIGLAGAHANDRLAIDKMLTQQCAEGFFRIFFGYIPTKEVGDHVTPNGYKVSTCDEGKAFAQSAPDGDTTGLALSAMLAARDAGAAGLNAPIAKAIKWLKAHQRASGGWGGGVGTEAPNTNSTGLIVQALADAGGADQAVAEGVAYLKSAQVTAKADTGNRLQDDVGAIAYNPGSYEAARTDGLSGLDTWIRASAQASLGLSQIGFHALTQGRKLPAQPAGGASAPPVLAPAGAKAGHQAPPGQTGGTVVNPPPAPSTPAGRLGGYLVRKLVGGDHVETTEDGKTYVDYDLTADLVLALRTLGGQPAAVSRVSGFLLNPDSVKAYAHGVPYEQGPASYAEPLAKLQIIARFRQADPDAPEGLQDTIDQLRTELAALRTDAGAVIDTGAYADTSGSVRRQAWAVLATTAASDSVGAEAAVKTLLAHRCQDGTFPLSLTTSTCATGDLAATAAAVEALTARPQQLGTNFSLMGQRKSEINVAPADWTPKRAEALAAAITALNARPDAAGVVHTGDGVPDVVLSSVVAGARQAAGLDVSATATALGGLLQSDGGFAKAPGSASDLVTSVAAAPGVAGRSWTSAEGSPLAAAVRLPLAVHDSTAPAAGPTNPAGVLPTWLLLRLIGLGVALAVAAFGARRHFTVRNNPGGTP